MYSQMPIQEKSKQYLSINYNENSFNLVNSQKSSLGSHDHLGLGQFSCLDLGFLSY